MHAEVIFSLPQLYGFLLVLTRVSGLFVFMPLPGVKSGLEIPRIALSLSTTMVLFPQWPAVDATADGFGQLAAWLGAEAALGITLGVAISFLIEAFVLAAQFTGLQAGYGYASTLDPTTEADSGILLVIAQLVGGMLFFAIGLDRELVRTLAASLHTYPPGSFAISRSAAEQIVRLGGDMFSTGLRLALPAIALLVLVDLALALLGRVNSQLQLLTLAFPAKMLASLIILAWIAVLFPTIYKSAAGGIIRTIHAVAQH